MRLVGVTGGIGAGKSTVSKVIETLGYKIYNCDVRAKELMHTNASLVSEIKCIFGDLAYLDGVLNRSYISGLAFKDKYLLEKLNNVVHPCVLNDIVEWKALNSSESLLFVESAILLESNISEIIDFSVNVYAPQELRIKRVCKRDNTDVKAVSERLKNQLSDKIREEKCDFTIICDDKTSIIQQVLKIIDVLMEK